MSQEAESLAAQKELEKYKDAMTRRIGKFYIGRDVIDNQPDAVMALLGQCVVMRAEFIMHTDQMEYIARCIHFGEIKKGASLPVYHAQLKADNGKYSVVWRPK